MIALVLLTSCSIFASATMAATAKNPVPEGLGIPRNTIVAKKAATVKLAVLFDEVDVVLKDHIDRLVFPLRKSNLEFYAAYRAARSIVDRPGGRNATNGEASPPASVPSLGPTGPGDASPAVRAVNSERGLATTPPAPTVEKQAA